MTSEMPRPAPALLPAQVTIAISTFGTGFEGVKLPPQTAGLRYVVLIQDAPAPLPAAKRADVAYVALTGLGLSHSRNAAIARCETEFLVFADDDMTFDPVGICALARELEQDPKLGFVVGWRAGQLPQSGRKAGRYHLHRFNAGRICAPELMVRTAAVRAAGIQFDPKFGVGAPLPIGEDYIFTCDMIMAGLQGCAFPVVAGAHPTLSTGDNWHDPKIQVARRAVLDRCFGKIAGAVRLAYALRHRKAIGGWGAAWRFYRGSA